MSVPSDLSTENIEHMFKAMVDYFHQNGIINIEDLQGKIDGMNTAKILDWHMENCSTIWQGKNNRWYTKVRDDSRKGGKRLIVKSTRGDLEKAVVGHYRSLEDKDSRKKITLRAIYPEWLAHKSLHSNSTSSMRRINDDWNKYYLGEGIIDTPLNRLTHLMLDEWSHRMVKEHSLTKTQYYNMSIIIRQSLQYAVSSGIIEVNPFENVKVQAKLFRVVKKKPDSTQVFLTDEQPQIEAEAWKDFIENDCTAPLAIILTFQLGARMGEICALKWSDINEDMENHIHIQRMETKVHKMLPDGTWHLCSHEVVEHTKSNAGNRNVYLTTKARQILDQVRDWNVGYGYGDNEYIFLGKDGKRIIGRILDTRIRKYCRNIGISDKSLHKIRKTYISTLLDSNLVNINTIRSQVGHEDERTTLKNYCFNRKSDLQTQADMEKVLCNR